jgi:hypothetical protein
MTKKSVFDSPDVDTNLFTPPQPPDQLYDPQRLVTKDSRKMEGRGRGVALTIRPNSSSVQKARNRTATSTARGLPMLLSQHRDNFTLSMRC